MARTRTSVPGSEAATPARTQAGFTLIELLIVVALIALASGIASLALRDPVATRLDEEAVRLSALLEGARAEARAAGLPVRWQVLDPEVGSGFRFVGLPGDAGEPMHWLHDGVSAQVVGASAVALGPEPVIAPQRIVLRLDGQERVLATDGLAPFTIVATDASLAAR
jgi:general secretion pathway protein H